MQPDSAAPKVAPSEAFALKGNNDDRAETAGRAKADKSAEERKRLPARRNRDEREFLPAALEIIDTPPSPVGRAIGLTIMAVAVVVVLWAALSNVDIIATTTGRIIPQGKTKVVQPLDTGIVSSIRVNDGDRVKAGDVLIELNTTQALADRDRFQRDLLQARLNLARLHGLAAAIAGNSADPGKLALVDPPGDASPSDVELAQAAMRAEAANQAAKLSDLDQQIMAKKAEAAEAQATADKLSASLPMVQSQEEIRRQLRDMQFGNKLAWYQANQALIEQQHDIGVLGRRKESAEAAQSALLQQRAATVAEYQMNVLSDLDKTRAQASELQAELAKSQQRLSEGVLTAPIDGTVQQLAIHTIGGVVTPAEPLLVIVPNEGRLMIEATVQNRDVGFIHAGQAVRIKVETFNFTRYGLIDGVVMNVTRDVVGAGNNDKRTDRDKTQDAGQDVGAEADSGPGYIAHITLARDWIMTEMGKVPLSPGMAVTAEIQTGQRRVIDYVLSPLVRHVSESLHER
ncbi:MAG TPA: HlyD family type I secretion periplasmic adaptor subunit [Dongiaceae bacterium]|nr:HlyD family type I secretion periplasmic adaptor subunit [Dongiaceae bacterium]